MNLTYGSRGDEVKKLPPGQLKKVLTDDVLAVLKKYGVELD